MSLYPPSPEPVPPAADSPARARLAAKIAVATPFVMFLVRLVFIRLESSDAPASLPWALFQAGILCLIVLAGFSAAVYALWSIGRHGRQGLLVKGLVGLALNAVLLLVVVLGMLFVIQKEGEQKEQTRRQLLRSVVEIREDVRDNAWAKDPQKTGDDYLRRLAAVHDRAAEDSTGVEKLMYEASTAYMEKLQQAGRPYMQAVDALLAAKVLLPQSNGTREKIARNRQLVETFIQSTLNFSNAVHHSGTTYRAELKTRSLPEDVIESAGRAFDENGASTRRQTQLLGIDIRLGTANLAILDLADQQFGQWKTTQGSDLFSFPDARSAEKYKELLLEIDTAVQARSDIQSEMTGRK